MNKLVFLLLGFSFVFTTFGQNDWLSFQSKNDTIKTVKNSLDFAQKPGKLMVIKDDRIAKIEDFVRADEASLDGVKIDGYRVLIFFDMSKSAAEQQKASFISVYPNHKAYMDYSAPNYRVRVGNFRTNLEAEKLKQEVLPYFPTAIVVADKIQLPQLPISEN